MSIFHKKWPIKILKIDRFFLKWLFCVSIIHQLCCFRPVCVTRGINLTQTGLKSTRFLLWRHFMRSNFINKTLNYRSCAQLEMATSLPRSCDNQVFRYFFMFILVHNRFWSHFLCVLLDFKPSGVTSSKHSALRASCFDYVTTLGFKIKQYARKSDQNLQHDTPNMTWQKLALSVIMCNR